MDQKSGETISKYIIRLKEQAQRCNFGDVLQESLRDKFVAGIIETPTQKKLLQEEGLTFEGALDIALSAESADNDLHNLKRSEDAHLSPQHLHAINNPCKHCGHDNHGEDPLMLTTVEEQCDGSSSQLQNWETPQLSLQACGGQIFQNEDLEDYQNPEEVLREALQIGDGVSIANIPLTPPIPLHFLSQEVPVIYGPVEPLHSSLDFSIPMDIDDPFLDEFDLELPADDEEALQLESELMDLIASESSPHSNEERPSSGHECPGSAEEKNGCIDCQEENCSHC
ncbi:hypothetical protein LAZ67_16000680 [Cordylochernes scorpioides]|uniref:Uncharacterized protein n=1 Tax=Cordylochernes scorpioides TaxID=51811 RepID=A0ABY6LBL9_9ARAC|nr:hypothetical protein LAZ67_16000680 [Cordylochernes scorpioides]